MATNSTSIGTSTSGRLRASASRRLLVLLLLLGAAASPAPAITLYQQFAIGPRTGNTINQFLNFSVPVGRSIDVSITISRVASRTIGSTAVPVRVTLNEPAANPSPSARGLQRDSRVINVGTAPTTIELANFIRSERGCPSPWTVVVAYDDDRSVEVSGRVAVTYSADNITLSTGLGQYGKINLNVGNSTTKSIAPLNFPGNIRIRAEFHTDPLDLLHFNSYYKITAKILRNGVEVASHTGFSQHAPADRTPKLDLRYFLRPEDVGVATFSLVIDNISSVKIVDFVLNKQDVFQSTITPSCN